MHFISFEAPVHLGDRIVGGESAPGRELAASIVRSVEQAGFEVIESVAPHDSYGWSFVVRAGAGRISCVLQLSDEWLLITHTSVSLLDRLRGRAVASAEHGRVDAALVDALASIPEVANVRWFGSQPDFREGRPGRP